MTEHRFGAIGRAGRVRPANVVLALLIVAYAVLFAGLSFARHDSFGTAGNDLGNMDQAVWNTSQGRFFESTNWRGGTNRLGAHVEPIMLPLALTYWIASTPKTLLVVQAILVALGAVPLFWLARRRLGSEWAALAFAAAYLLFPALQAANLYEFHPLTLTAPFFALAVVGLLERRTWLFAIGAVLAVACKEDMPLITAAMGVYAGLVQRRFRLAAITIGLSVVWFFFATSIVIPTFNPTGRSPYLPRYQALGDSIPSIAITLLTQPWRAAPLLEGGDPFGYLLALLAPVGLLALLAPAVLLPVVPPLAVNLLSNSVLQKTVEINHYPAPMVPFVVAAAITGAERAVQLVKRRRPERAGWALGALAIIVVLCSVGYQRARGFTPLAHDFEMKPVVEHHRIAERLIALVPTDASVTATPQLNPHLTQRRQVVVYPRGLDFDIVFLDTWPPNVPMVVEDQFQTVQRLLANGYGLRAAEDGLLLLQRGVASQATPADAYRTMLAPAAPPGTRLEARFGDAIEIVGYDLVPETPSTTYFVLHLRAGSRPADNVRVWIVPGDTAWQPEPGAEVQLAGPTFLPPVDWPAGAIFRALTPTEGRWRRPGRFTASVVVTNGGSPADPSARLPVRVTSGNGQAVGSVLRLALLESDGKVTRDITPPILREVPDGVPALQPIGDGVSASGVVAGCGAPGPVQRGCTLTVGLYWRSSQLRQRDETVFLHLVGLDGRPVAQSDGPPAGSDRPTTSWQAGEVVTDLRQIALPTGIASGRYQVIAGLYDPASGARVSGQRDSVLIGEIEFR